MFLARKWKLQSTCAEDHFWETHFQKKVWSTLEFEQKIVKLPAKLSRRNCQNCILRFQRNNVGVYFFWKHYQIFVFLGFGWRGSAFSTTNFRQACDNCIFFVSRGTFSMKIFFKIYKTILLIGLWGKNFRRLSKNFSAGSKNCILQVWGIFEEQKFFESRVQNQFRTFLENFWYFFRYSKQCCHVCTLRVKMIV